MVRDVVAVQPGTEPTPDARTLARLEEAAVSWMDSEGIRKTGSTRLKLFGTDAVRVDGFEKEEPSYVTEVAFYRNRRRFTVRCFASSDPAWTRCARALDQLVIHDIRETPQPGDRPHVLHLRDEKHRIEFDAPDDTWLAVGPRTGGDGAQIIWIWFKDGRQIDVPSSTSISS